MVANSQNKGLSITPEAELAKVVEQTTLEQERAGVVAATKDTLGRFGAVFALTAALTAGNPAAAVESPYEPLADGSGQTMLVLKNGEAPKLKAELFAAFDANGIPECKDLFQKITPKYQEKTLGFFRTGKEEQPNMQKLLKGTYNLMLIYDNITIGQRALAEYAKTGKNPSENALRFSTPMKLVKSSFPSAAMIVDIDTMTRIDTLLGNMNAEIVAK